MQHLLTFPMRRKSLWVRKKDYLLHIVNIPNIPNIPTYYYTHTILSTTFCYRYICMYVCMGDTHRKSRKIGIVTKCTGKSRFLAHIDFSHRNSVQNV
jgi:hypothetical protein